MVAGVGTGQLQSISRDDGTTVRSLQFTYDGPLPASTTWAHASEVANGSVSYGYDAHFRLDQVRVNGQVTADYAYDADGLITSAGALTVTPDAVTGLLSSTTLGDVSDSYSWTSFAELDTRDSTYLGSLYYREDVDATTRDARGRIRDVTEEITTTGTGPLDTRTRGYAYDPAGRLQYVFEDGTQVSEYVYGPNGNRLQHVQATGTVVGVYDDQDRLTQYCPQDGTGAPLPTAGLPCYAYAYNASGQLEARTDLGTSEVTSYDYDELGGLRSVQASAGDAIAYELDAAGRRVGKRINGTAVRGWLYQDALNPVAELDGSGAVVSTFVYATMGHVPDYMVKGGQTYRIVTDHLGSVRLVVNVADGSVAQRVDYDEFGVATLVSGSWDVQPFGFAGGLYDADTGLVRFGARDYDAVVGRWTRKDPILLGGGQANLYVYVGGDPANRIDSWGFAGGEGGLLGGVSWLHHTLDGYAVGFSAIVAGGTTVYAGTVATGILIAAAAETFGRSLLLVPSTAAVAVAGAGIVAFGANTIAQQTNDSFGTGLPSYDEIGLWHNRTNANEPVAGEDALECR